MLLITAHAFRSSFHQGLFYLETFEKNRSIECLQGFQVLTNSFIYGIPGSWEQTSESVTQIKQHTGAPKQTVA